MKKLSDYKGNEAIELWADLLTPLTSILNDEKVVNVIKSKLPKTMIAQAILKNHTEDAITILTRIDDEPINGLTLVVRLLALLADIGQSEEIKSFFGYAGQANKASESSGSATANTMVEES